MKKFTITKNEFLSRDTEGFFRADYYSMYSSNPEHPKYINIIKNDKNQFKDEELRNAFYTLKDVLKEDLNKLVKELNIDVISIVPRAKVEDYYSPRQLLFKRAVKEVVEEIDNVINGVDFIKRVENTVTTHMNHMNGGIRISKGISLNSCSFDEKLKDKIILLVDDIYTKTVNIDEDMIEALYKKGAKKVYFYAVAKTLSPIEKQNMNPLQ